MHDKIAAIRAFLVAKGDRSAGVRVAIDKLNVAQHTDDWSVLHQALRESRSVLRGIHGTEDVQVRLLAQLLGWRQEVGRGVGQAIE